MGAVSAPLTSGGNERGINTPVLHLGERTDQLIIVSPALISRATLESVDVDGFTEENPKDAVYSWVGRFATNELWDAGIQVSGWSSFGISVEDPSEAFATRELPFVVRNENRSKKSPPLKVAEEGSDEIEVERAFTERAIAFLADMNIIR